jgi:hypothetical protein
MTQLWPSPHPNVVSPAQATIRVGPGAGVRLVGTVEQLDGYAGRLRSFEASDLSAGSGQLVGAHRAPRCEPRTGGGPVSGSAGQRSSVAVGGAGAADAADVPARSPIRR